MTNRAARRSISRREWQRRYHRDIPRILELGGQGVSPRAIGSKLGLNTTFVQQVLDETNYVEKEASQ